MKIAKWLVAAALPTLLLGMAVYDIQSNGAPMGNTNAPGELTCNHSGCHVGNALNSGGAALSVDFGGAQTYNPGVVYPVTIEIADSGKERFGFQVLALQNQDSTNAGTFIVTDSARTKMQIGIQQYAGRTYMTYKFPGTAAIAPGVGRWTFNWQAPSSSSPVTFYTAAAVANNDGTDQGDFIHTKTVTLPANPTAAEAAAEAMASSTVWPNPCSGQLNITYRASGKCAANFWLQNLATQVVFQLPPRKDTPGQQHFKVDLRDQIPAGSYLLWIRQGSDARCHKIMIAR